MEIELANRVYSREFGCEGIFFFSRSDNVNEKQMGHICFPNAKENPQKIYDNLQDGTSLKTFYFSLLVQWFLRNSPTKIKKTGSF